MINSTNSAITYTANGTQTVFSFPYSCYAQAWLVVTVITNGTAVVQSLGNYTVSPTSQLPSDAPGMTVTFGSQSIPVNGATVLIQRVLPQTQGLSIPDNSKFPGPSVEQSLDQAILLIQQLQAALGFQISIPNTSPLSGTALQIPDPNLVANQGKVLMTGPSGVVLANASQAAYVSPLTSKGDILIFDTVPDRLPVGPDGTAVVADSSQSFGLRYSNILAVKMTIQVLLPVY